MFRVKTVFRSKKRSNSIEESTILEEEDRALDLHAPVHTDGDGDKRSNCLRRISGGLVLDGDLADVSGDDMDEGTEGPNVCRKSNTGEEEVLGGRRLVLTPTAPDATASGVDNRRGVSHDIIDELSVLVVDKLFCVISDHPSHSFFAQMLRVVARRCPQSFKIFFPRIF